jgi:hypothetical protein
LVGTEVILLAVAATGLVSSSFALKVFVDLLQIGAKAKDFTFPRRDWHWELTVSTRLVSAKRHAVCTTVHVLLLIEWIVSISVFDLIVAD